MTRPLLKPEWTQWGDIFKAATPVDLLKGHGVKGAVRYDSRTLYTWEWRENEYTKKGRARSVAAAMYLSSGCSLNRRGHRRLYLDIELTDQCLELIKGRALQVSWDTISLECTEWDNGQALVTYHHSKIIGGSWIAKIDASTIPQFKESDDV